MTDIYIRKLSPVVFSRSRQMNLPVWFVYSEVMRFLDNAAANNDNWKKYKADLVGPETIVEAPERYYDINLIVDMGIPLTDWDDPTQYSLRDKAEIRAARYLKNMVDVVEHHYKIQDEKMRKVMAGNNGQSENH